ncbi:MAG: bifunctional SulP family inorganic anion transporter/carbonic anhydrase [Pirellulaceae bacterium]|nr:bifunctional SulP family inorganic anion transporter/carbonic anhydrase [Pirellulaceae bacterium]
MTGGTLLRDFTAGTVVFLVALPLCLGIALASNAPPFAGILAGIIGGVLVGLISGSHTSVSGPAAGLTAIVAAQIGTLGSFEAFLFAVAIGGIIQILLGVAKAGFIASFFPSSVIKGLLAAIGLILILKQLPYLLGHEAIGENAFEEMAKESGGHEKGGHQNPVFSLVVLLSGTYHIGPLSIGLLSLAILIGWDKCKPLKKSIIPSPLIVVLVGVAMAWLFEQLGGRWTVGTKQLVNVPVANNFAEFIGFLKLPDFSVWSNPDLYIAAVTIAIVATLESMLNLEAVDNLDPQQRVSPPNRELVAQGVGNLVSGLIGGLPMTCVVVRGSVNIYAGAQTKLSAIIHGCFLFGFALWLPHYLNKIPLACLAAILFMTGYKLASPKLVRQLYKAGRLVFLPFVITVAAIVMTDLLIGILIGLGVSVLFILSSNYKRPIRKIVEKHIGGDVHHIELANQVSFLNRAVLEKSMRDVPRGGHILLDARNTDYIDPDILTLIREFRDTTAPALGVNLSFKGFHDKYALNDNVTFVDHSTLELQRELRPLQVLQLLQDGNTRFRTGQSLSRDLQRQMWATAQGQFPVAVIMTCMDSRTPTQVVFDMGLGDLLNVCQAGNALLGRRTLASVEYGCAVAGAKLVVIMGHVHSSVMDTAITFACSNEDPTSCGQHFEHIVQEINLSIDDDTRRRFPNLTGDERGVCVNKVARNHVLRSVQQLTQRSSTIQQLVDERMIAIVGAMYDPRSGKIDFMLETAVGLTETPELAGIN